MKRILFILLFFCSIKTFAQVPPPDSCGGNRVPTCINWYKALAADSAFYIPVRTGLNRYIAKGTLAPRPQIFIYNDILYYYTNGNYYSVSGGSTFDTVSLSNRIDLRMLISDTVNNFGGRFLSNIIGISAGGDLSSTYPNPTVAKFNGQFPAYYLNYNNLTNKPSAYTLPIASSTILGGIKVGTGLAIDGAGILSASGSSPAGLNDVTAINNSTTDSINVIASDGTRLVSLNKAPGFFGGEYGYIDIANNDGLGVHSKIYSSGVNFYNDIDTTALFLTAILPDTTIGHALKIRATNETDTIATLAELRTSIASINLDAIDVGVKVVQPVGVATYVVPVGTLVETILIQEPTNITVDVGTTPGGNDLIAGWNITGGASSLGLNYYSTSSSTIYVTGLTGSSQLKIYKR